MSGLLGFWQRIPIQRRKRIALFVLATMIVVATLWAARSVLGLYFIGLILAYLLGPIVDAIEAGMLWLADKAKLGFLRRIARSTSIMLTYLLLISLIVGFIALVVPMIVRESQQLWEARNRIWEQISVWGEGVLEQYELLPERVRQQVDDTLRDLSASVTRILQQAVEGTVVAIQYTFSVVLGITIVPFWAYFLLRDYDQIRSSIYDSLPRAVQEDVGSIVRLLDRTIGSYLRGELVLMIVVGVLQTVGMTIVGVPYALVLGVIAGLLEVVPNIGPTLAAVPAILVALSGGPVRALLALAVARVVQMIENSLIVPRVLGQTMGLHPVVLMVMLVVGAEIAGLPGLILAPILTAVLRDVYRYLLHRFADNPCRPEEALRRVTAGEPFHLNI